MTALSKDKRRQLSRTEEVDCELGSCSRASSSGFASEQVGNGVLLFQARPDSFCQVQDLHPTGAAARDGRIQVGDHLLV